MSSRNRYLSLEEREQALVLSRALRRVEASVAAGETKAAALLAAAAALIVTAPAVRVDYLAAVDPSTLEAVEQISAETLFAVAAHLGRTRLIDNVLLHAPGSQGLAV